MAAVIIYLLVWYGPDLIARHDIGNVTGLLRVLRLQQARDAARGRLLTLGAGIFAAGALIFTAQNYRVARRTLDVTEQGQVTGRFTKAISHIGSSRIDVRIGGIYSLEQVARDSDRDHPIVMAVLSSFIRRHSQEPLTPPGPGEKEPERSTRPDIQASIAVIGRRDEKRDIYVLDLNHANLTDAILDWAKLTALFTNAEDVPYLGRVRFTGEPHIGVYLDGAQFIDATLKSANLTLASLIGANFTRADLTGANFTQANLTGAELTKANLTRANLTRANLTRANLSHANLTRPDPGYADFYGANLTDAIFTGADLNGALFPPDAVIPDGWEREPGSDRLRRTNTSSDGTAAT